MADGTMSDRKLNELLIIVGECGYIKKFESYAFSKAVSTFDSLKTRLAASPVKHWNLKQRSATEQQL
jgi:hypothetical protein